MLRCLGVAKQCCAIYDGFQVFMGHVIHGREEFWEEVGAVYGLRRPKWCLVGDFNVTRSISEKMGSRRITTSTRQFDRLIRESGVGASGSELVKREIYMVESKSGTNRWSTLFTREWGDHFQFGGQYLGKKFLL
ncbi:hypothetical protein Syun_012502 [Stephania yunnanensis]|uniref:Endonuclease/exonuclease/phosphatase domain-containing protein n=1 Tax=Stephania yunnanensis TaxID=152371 RepID=A0AAP0K1X6_9MAGN